MKGSGVWVEESQNAVLDGAFGFLAPNCGNYQQEADENQRHGSYSHFAQPQVNLCDCCTLARALWARELRGRRMCCGEPPRYFAAEFSTEFAGSL
jgi:hypothetical protein